MSDTPVTKYLTRSDLCNFLQARGFPITLNMLNVLCSPSRGEGPPVAAVWPSRAGAGRGRLLYDPTAALAWAENRLRHPEAA